MSKNITFIGFGEAGQTISRGLLAEHAVRIRAYDILFDDAANEGRQKRVPSLYRPLQGLGDVA